MQRLFSLALLAVVVGGGWTYIQNALPTNVRQAVQTAGTVFQQQPNHGPAAQQPSGGGYAPQQPAYVSSRPGFAPAQASNAPPTIRIATFNIQNFGTKKATKPYVMDAIARVVRSFDVIAIQEIATQEDPFIQNFLRDYVNTNGVYYDARVSERLGRTTNTERYAFLFNTATIEVHERLCSVFPDPEDRLHREPYVALFKTRVAPPHRPFTFTLINTHTDPDEIPQELNDLYSVYRNVQRTQIQGSSEDDVILLGDLNTKVPASSPYGSRRTPRSLSPRDLGKLSQVPGISPLIRSQATTPKSSLLHDNILIPSFTTVEFTGRKGVMDLRTELNYVQNGRPIALTEKQVLEISDHLPVWGEFSAIEGGGYRSAGR